MKLSANPLWRLLAVGFMAASCLAGCAAVTKPPVAWKERVETDGARLYLLARGEDASAPPLLWLHGGPGGAETPLFRMFNGDLEKTFVVAYWDQRGAGRSFDKKADPAKLTVARHVADLDIVVDRLRARLHKDRIVLVGHSWGAALGLLYARDHADKIAAVIAVNPVVSLLESQRSQYAFVAAESEARGDAKAAAALARLGAPPYDWKDELAMQKLVDGYGGLFHERPNFLWTTARALFGGYAAPWEIGGFIRANNVSLEAMNDELLALDLEEAAPAVGAPALFALGRYDRQVDSAIAARYVEGLAAPQKSLVWFERSAHNIPFEEPQALEAAIAAFLRDQGVLASGPRG